jgi:hypothetical protein
MVEHKRGRFGDTGRGRIGRRGGGWARDSSKGESEDAELACSCRYSTDRLHHGVLDWVRLSTIKEYRRYRSGMTMQCTEGFQSDILVRGVSDARSVPII